MAAGSDEPPEWMQVLSDAAVDELLAEAAPGDCEVKAARSEDDEAAEPSFSAKSTRARYVQKVPRHPEPQPPVLAAASPQPSPLAAPGPRAAQLVQLLLGGRAGHDGQRGRLAAYVAGQAARATAFPRRLFVLRGPPGCGKSTWAATSLLGEVEAAVEDEFAARLAHVCSADDFSMQFVDASSDTMHYVPDAGAPGSTGLMNEARVRLAMELGIEPLYVDNAHMALWEMRPYVALADRLGYTVTVVPPHEICPDWRDLDYLMARNEEKQEEIDKVTDRSAVQAALSAFEDLGDDFDPCPSIRAAERPLSDAPVRPSDCQALLSPCVVLYKFEKLLMEGSGLLRYTPADGKGWGVNGELVGEWHSFREKGDGSCCYEDGDLRAWQTGVPETSWSFADLEMLDLLKSDARSLPEASLPSATTHPSLFAHGNIAASRPVKSELRDKDGENEHRDMEEDEDEEVKVLLPPMSRKERFKQRMMMKAELEEEIREEKEKAARSRATKASVTVPTPNRTSAPLQAEESSAADFLAAVKARLAEWGKLDQYLEFVSALSDTVDCKTAVRILRGHDDLLQVFRNKFAPRSDLTKIKAEVHAEDTPHPPGMRVKREVVQAAWGSTGDAPHAPSGPPPQRRVKEEVGPRLAKSEMGRPAKKELFTSDEIPRPPSSDPRAPRVVTLDEESDEDLPDEESIAVAVSKGPESCIAELAKIIFRKERLAHQGVRPRLSMVRYGTKKASCPRFPRELFILRGAPGVGKTDHAKLQLIDAVDIEAGDEEAARLTHICGVDDFFETCGPDGSTYKFNAARFEAYHSRNEMRVRLAMEAGIHPIYVDCPNMRLWEMKPYVKLADRLGYVTTIVEPLEIADRAGDLKFLSAANDTAVRHAAGKAVPKVTLSAILGKYEPLPVDQDHLAAIRAAVRPAGEPRVAGAVSGVAAKRQQMGFNGPAQKKMKVKMEASR